MATISRIPLVIDTNNPGGIKEMGIYGGNQEKLDPRFLPAIAIVDFLGIVASEVAMLLLTGEKGDWCIRSDLSDVWIIIGDDPSQLSSWQEFQYPAFAGVVADSPLSGLGTSASHLIVDLSSKPSKVNPSVDGNLVAFNGATGDQKDSAIASSAVITKTTKTSGTVAAGWWRFAQSSSLPCNGIFKIKYYRGTVLHSMIVQVAIFDGCTTPNITIMSNTLGT